MTESFEQRFKGLPVSPGIAMGQLLVKAHGSAPPSIYYISAKQIDSEWIRYEKALNKTEDELKALMARVEDMSCAHEAAIFDAHILFLRDKTINEKLRSEIKKRMQNIDSVYYAVVQNFMELMRHIDDPYLSARVADMEDVMRRVLKNLSQNPVEHSERSVDDGKNILVAYDLSPSDTADLDRKRTLGFVTEAGSTVSHTAILARSLGLPAVVAVPKLVVESTAGVFAILDGYSGLLILNPEEATKEYYLQLQVEKDQAYSELCDMKDLPAETLDGRKIRLAANVEFAHEYESILESGAEGVGLYRTEFFLLGNGPMPDEEAQYKHYRMLAEGCAPHEVIFRTLDSGGDKLPFEMQDQKEDNPFLGWRGVRVSLSRPEFFKTQLCAILRSSAHGKAGVMFPMISGLTELLEVKEILAECQADLDQRGLAYDPAIRIGVMIEVPSAAMMADILAEHVDFFSIGTNDLTQYTIAVDRVNFRVASMFRPTHPGVIRLIHHTIKAGIPTAICGETGSDLSLVPLLVGLGAHELSVGTHCAPLIRYAIRHLNYEDCKEVARLSLLASNSLAIRTLSRDLAMKSYPKLFQIGQEERRPQLHS